MVSYNTKQKQLVLEIVLKYRSRQLSCDEILAVLTENKTPVGKTTVYRQLEKLVADGKIKKVFSPDLKSYTYQYIDESMNCSEHMHLRCKDCGKYVHLGCDFMSKVNDHILEHHDFVVDNSHTEIVGLCRQCSLKRG